MFFTLEVKVRSVSYPKFTAEWEVPRSLLLLGQEAYPVMQLESGYYETGYAWVLQAIKPGVIDLSNVGMQINHTG